MHIDTITITGIIASDPTVVTTENGLTVFSTRVAARTQRYDKQVGKWVPGDTNWYTVNAFRYLATNAGASLHKGDRIVATGRLRLRQWKTDSRQGMTAEIDADAIGHDLTWGTSQYVSALAPQTASVDETSAATEEVGKPAVASALEPAFDQPTPF